MPNFHRTVKNALVEEIRDEILRGTYQPGQRLRLNDLAQRFDVSNMPVREALRHLESEGIVTNIPHKGAYVTRLSVDEMQDIYDIRATLEALATRLAVPRMTPATMHELERLVAAMDEQMETVATFIKLNHQFHMTLYAASQRTHLCQLIRTLRYRMHHYMFAFKTQLGDMAQIQAEHRAIMAACAAGEADRAARLVEAHVASVGQAIIQHMRQAEELGDPAA